MRYKKSKRKQPDKRPLIQWAAFGSVFLAIVIMHGLSVAARQDEDRKVSQIAKKFDCICDMNCSLRLDECKCSIPGGAREKKEFIRNHLKKGMKASDVVVLLNQKYGGLRTNDVTLNTKGGNIK